MVWITQEIEGERDTDKLENKDGQGQTGQRSTRVTPLYSTEAIPGKLMRN